MLRAMKGSPEKLRRHLVAPLASVCARMNQASSDRLVQMGSVTLPAPLHPDTLGRTSCSHLGRYLSSRTKVTAVTDGLPRIRHRLARNRVRQRPPR